MYSYCFSICDIVIKLETSQEIRTTDRFLPFVIERQDADYIITFEEVDELSDIDDQYVFLNDCFKVILDNLESRLFYVDYYKTDEIYAVGQYDYDNRKSIVRYKKDAFERLCESSNCFYHIAWEHIMMKESRLLFHSCCVDFSYGGILFSGDSGIGKSTQGDLWVKYEKARIINGDRPIVYKDGNAWFAYGSPYAGSSHVYLNERCKIKAIVMLQQSSENTIRKISGIEAFQKLYAQMVVNVWNREFVDKIVSLVEMMIQDIPIYELSCTPDRRAVDLLRQTLNGE